MERVDVSDNKTRRFNNKPTRIEASDLYQPDANRRKPIIYTLNATFANYIRTRYIERVKTVKAVYT